MDQYRNYLHELQRTLDCLPLHLIDKVTNMLFEARMNNRQVFIMGNGGSASTASHFACDLGKNTRLVGWPNFRVNSLNDNMAVLSAYANDEGYENVFVEQLASFIQPQDVVIGISTSGNSPNVNKAIDLARKLNALTIGFTGFDGGLLGTIVDVNLHVPNFCIEQVEDVHLMLEHIITKELRERLQISPSKTQSIISEEVEEEIVYEIPNQESSPDGSNFQVLEKDQTVSDLLHVVNSTLLENINFNNKMQNILNIMVQELQAYSGNLILFNEFEEPMESFTFLNGKNQQQKRKEFTEIVDKGLAGWVKENQVGALVRNTQNDTRWLKRSWEVASGKPRSAISVPFLFKQKIIGVITLVHMIPRKFSIEELAILTLIVANVSLQLMKFQWQPPD